MAVVPFSVRSAPTMVPGVFRPYTNRSFAGLYARVTVEETARDEVTVTEHPVEQGAPIGDHAFKRQQEVTIQAGWSFADGDLSAESGIYGILLDWQASFVPFELVTGKRIHKNMLITGISVTTNQETEFALMLQLTCREVILTQTQTSPDTAGSEGDRSTPETTGTGTTAKTGPAVTKEVVDEAVAREVDAGWNPPLPTTTPPEPFDPGSEPFMVRGMLLHQPVRTYRVRSRARPTVRYVA